MGKVVFTKDAAKRIVRTVTRVETKFRSNVNRREVVPFAGRGKTISIFNNSGYPLPKGAFVKVDEISNGIYSCSIAPFPGLHGFAIVAGDLAIAANGSAFITGIVPVLMHLSYSPSAIVFGKRWDVVANDYITQETPMGSLISRGVDINTGSGETDYLVAEIDKNRFL